MGAWPTLAYHDSGETRPEVQRAYRMLVFDGIFAQTMAMLITGAFFTAFVLALGASNTLVGVLSAAAPLTQVLQWPAARWVAHAQSWRRVTVITAGIGRSAWFVAAALPWFAPVAWRLPLLLAIISVHFVSNGVTCCAFNAWMRGIIPGASAGRFFGHRTAWSTAAGVVAGLIAGYVVHRAELAGNALAGYSASIFVGTIIGWIGLWFLVKTPEAPRPAPASTGNILLPPATKAQREVYVFLGLWAFALALAQPFMMVYLLEHIRVGTAWAMALSMSGQALNVALFPAWGRLADRFTNRAVLRLTCTGGALSLLLWPLAAHAPGLSLQVFLAAIALLLGGTLQSGALLCCYLINLKSAPDAAPALALARGNFFAGGAALVASALGGCCADGFDGWGMHERTGLHGLDIIFFGATLVGLCAALWLQRVHEAGDGRGRDVLRALFGGAI